MTDKLLPCPFCGGDAVLATRDGWHVATCNDAVCPGYQCMYIHSEAKGAIAAWNTRARVSSFAVLAITTAYEQGVGKGREHFHTKREIKCPYSTSDTYSTNQAWHTGFAEGEAQAERAAQGPTTQKLIKKLSMRPAGFYGEKWISEDEFAAIVEALK